MPDNQRHKGALVNPAHDNKGDADGKPGHNIRVHHRNLV